MSLKNFTKYAQGTIEHVFPKPRFPYNTKTRPIVPTTGYPKRVGVAFDYLLRIYLQNKFKSINKTNDTAYLCPDFPCVAELAIKHDGERMEFCEKFHKRRVSYKNIAEMIPDCLMMANLDYIWRSGDEYPNDRVLYTDQKDIDDLTNLIKIVTPNTFHAKQQLVLNPTFGESSRTVGGGDADFILDDTLIDIKTVNNLRFNTEDFCQLLGYHFLNKREGNIHGTIKHLGIYFSRFATLYTFPIPKPKLFTNTKSGDKYTGWDELETILLIYRFKHSIMEIVPSAASNQLQAIARRCEEILNERVPNTALFLHPLSSNYIDEIIIEAMRTAK